MIKISPFVPGTAFLALLFPAFLIWPGVKVGTAIGRKTEMVKIGFLIPQPVEQDNLSREAFYGAQLAIEQANHESNPSNRIFEMVTLSTNGPWGSGSKRAVKLVYEDQVSGMVISLDGRNAHLAEQVITKARVALIVTRATDPTITKAFVPWVFRILPNDEQQAKLLVKEVYQSRGFQNIFLLTIDSYDANGGAQAFLKAAKANHFPSPTQISVNLGNELAPLGKKIRDGHPDALVFFGLPAEAQKFMVKAQPDVPVFGPISLLYDDTFTESAPVSGKKLYVIEPGFMLTEKGKFFQQSFKERYGFLPGAIAANAYEGMKMMLEAISKNGSDRDAIREFLLNVRDYQGINGVINFDENGNLKFWKGILRMVP